MNPPRVALIHDWLTGMRGGEYVFEAIAELFPDAEIFTLLSIPGKISPKLNSFRQHTSWLQKVPGAESKYRYFLPLMPQMIESFDLTGFDLIISSSHCVAKGIRKPKGAVHVSYVHAPMRYIWERFDDYFGKDRASPAVRFAASVLRPRLQAWDREVSSEQRVDLLIANSEFIAGQIERAYRRKAEVVHPFANLARFGATRNAGVEYLMVGAFAPNKRVDLAIEAFNRLNLPLAIVGSGQEEARLRAMAGRTIRFLGNRSNEEIADLYSRCRAFIFPGIEDFGITPLEAMASGAPVIAYGEGGALETVTEETGLIFRPQSAEALMEAVQRLEDDPMKIREASCRARAAEFSKEKFQRKLKELIDRTWIGTGRASLFAS